MTKDISEGLGQGRPILKAEAPRLGGPTGLQKKIGLAARSRKKIGPPPPGRKKIFPKIFAKIAAKPCSCVSALGSVSDSLTGEKARISVSS